MPVARSSGICSRSDGILLAQRLKPDQHRNTNTGEGQMKKLLAEFVGTLTLVLFGCGAAVLAGTGNVGQLGIAFAFGLAIVAMAYGIGPISGCHVNPAVSFGAFLAGRMGINDMVLYWVAQFLGALAGAGI